MMIDKEELLEVHSIPNEVLDELKREYGSVNFEKYGTPHPKGFESRAAGLLVVDRANVKGKTYDNDSNLVDVLLDHCHMYKLRGLFKETGAEIYSASIMKMVLHSGDIPYGCYKLKEE